MKYTPTKIERKLQKHWETKKFYVAKDKVANRENFYFLVEFPYPSGDLHIGHWYAFSVPDIAVRYWRMKGKNVMYPIGFDAFGLPAENAAIQRGLQPEDWTKKNIAYMTKQLKSMGTTFDWSRVISTIDPDYYKWTQWIFLQFYKKGLAYRAETLVNWCPKDKTVLANEQVVEKSKIKNQKLKIQTKNQNKGDREEKIMVKCCERCGTEVVQKEMVQWMYKITDYADRLIDDLEKVDWPEVTKTAQRNWIGRSRGAEIHFLLPNSTETIKTFTTRADTLYGATYLVLAPEHPLVTKITKDQCLDSVSKYLETTKKKSELERTSLKKEKTGVFTGAYAVSPINNEKIPIWVADYIVGWYGTGAVMAVPAHDERDFEFANKFKLSVKIVIEPETGKILPNEQSRRSIVAIIEDPKSKKFLTLNWGPKLGGTLFIGGGREEGEDEVGTALREIREETGYSNLTFVQKTERMHHHYFAFSKGVARNIEVVGLHFLLAGDKQEQKNLQHDEKDNFEIEWLTKEEVLRKMEDENHLLSFRRLVLGDVYTGPGLLTNSDEFNRMSSELAKNKIVEKLKEKGLAEFKNNYKLHDWVLSRQRYWGTPIPMINCPKCGYRPVLEKDLPVKLPKLEDYKPSADGRSPLAKAKEWLKVKCPNCGGEAERETDTMDTFVDSSWYFLRYTDPKNKNEFANPAKMKNWLPVDLYVGGTEHNTMHLLYSRFFTKAMHDLGLLEFDEPFTIRRNHGVILGPDSQKMSKSRGNVIDPDDLVKKYGADTIRMHLAFMGPYEQGGPWNPGGILGAYRFLNRVWNLAQSLKLKIKKKLNPKPYILDPILHKTIKKVGEDIENLRFNTAVSELMKLLNEMEKYELGIKNYELFLKLLAPLAPHLTEEIWINVLGNKKSIHLEKWPEYNPKLIVEEAVKLVVQINGRTRSIVEVLFGADEEAVKKLAIADERVKKYTTGIEIKKIIFVKNRLINFVI